MADDPRAMFQNSGSPKSRLTQREIELIRKRKAQEPTEQHPAPYIILESPDGSYPDLDVASETSHDNLGWSQTHESLYNKNKGFILTPKQLSDYLNHLRSGKPVYDKNGDEVDPSVVVDILSAIYGKEDPWRGEWLNAKYEKDDKGIIQVSHQVDPQSGNQIVIRQHIGDCLMEPRDPKTPVGGIDLASWLENPNPKGYPNEDVAKGSMIYRPPEVGAVAAFGVSAAAIIFYGNRNLEGRLGLGGRAAYFRK